jgi:hypothetical protein
MNRILDDFYRREVTGLASNTAIELAYDLSIDSYQDQRHFLRLLLRLIVQMELSGKISEGTLQTPTGELNSKRAEVRASTLGNIEDYLLSVLSEKASESNRKNNSQSPDYDAARSSSDMTQSQDSLSCPSFNPVRKLASIESDAMLSAVAEPEKDANQQALDQVEKATDSERDKGEDLLKSEDLKRQLREAKERLESSKPPRK